MRKLLAAAAFAVLCAPRAIAQTLVITLGGTVSGEVEIALAADVAPGHAERLVTLAEQGAYDGVVFHRVIDGFMAQTGDVAHGRHGSDLSRAGFGASDLPDLRAEFSDLSFETGVVGMARGPHPDSANSQFFIMFAPAPHLNGAYTVIGRVTKGQDLVDAIKRGSKAQNGVVRDPDYMVSVRVRP